MRYAAGLLIGLALAVNAASAAEPAPPETDASIVAFLDYVAAMQTGVYFIGLCEKYRDKAELADVEAVLARDPAALGEVQRKMLEEMRTAHASGQAKAAEVGWTAAQCNDAIDKNYRQQAAARAEFERLDVPPKGK